jgi:hypothetical protein
MHDFALICGVLGLTATARQVTIGDNPPLTVNYNPGTQSLVAVLNAGVHITIYQNSWDGQVQIPDYAGGNSVVGPFCLHTTAGNERWFRQYRDHSWEWVTDFGTPSYRYLRAFDSMMGTLWPYLSD